MAPTIKPREALIGKAMMDKKFAQQLIDNPTEAVKKAGITLSATDMKRLQSLTTDQRAQLLNNVQGAMDLNAYLDKHN